MSAKGPSKYHLLPSFLSFFVFLFPPPPNFPFFFLPPNFHPSVILVLFYHHTTCVDMRQYVSKRISVQLNKGRHVTGVLLGFDQFMNIVLDGMHVFYVKMIILCVLFNIHAYITCYNHVMYPN